MDSGKINPFGNYRKTTNENTKRKIPTEESEKFS